MRRTTTWVGALVLGFLGVGTAAVALVSASPPDRDLGNQVVLSPAPVETVTPTPVPAPVEPVEEEPVEPVEPVEKPGDGSLVPVQPAPPRSGSTVDSGTGTAPSTGELPYDDGMYHPGDEYDDGMYRPSDEYDDGMWTPDTGNG
ncbi:hypothetical protein ACFWFR_07995 [Oerskovia sp. NPDC060287]|uniref:hypothetical protein n=1 Tax=Oerskovia sp. NPDC060287 TaxID=3347095 RepID=UPI00366A23FC